MEAIINFDFFKITNGTIIRLNNDNTRDWVCIHHSNCDMEHREKMRKNNKNQTGFYLFGGLWYDGDPLTSKPYGKCIEHLEKGMANNIFGIVGHISKDFEVYKLMQRIPEKEIIHFYSADVSARDIIAYGDVSGKRVFKITYKEGQYWVHMLIGSTYYPVDKAPNLDLSKRLCISNLTMKAVTVNDKFGLTTSVIPHSNDKYPVWFYENNGAVEFIEAKEVVFIF